MAQEGSSAVFPAFRDGDRITGSPDDGFDANGGQVFGSEATTRAADGFMTAELAIGVAVAVAVFEEQTGGVNEAGYGAVTDVEL